MLVRARDNIWTSHNEVRWHTFAAYLYYGYVRSQLIQKSTANHENSTLSESISVEAAYQRAVSIDFALL